MRFAGSAHRVGDLPDDLPDVLQTELAAFGRWRSDADERHVGGGDGFLVILRGREQAVFRCLGEEIVQPRFDDGRHAGGERLDFFGMHIDAHNGVPFFSETPGGDRANIAKTEN